MVKSSESKIFGLKKKKEDGEKREPLKVKGQERVSLRVDQTQFTLEHFKQAGHPNRWAWSEVRSPFRHG